MGVSVPVTLIFVVVSIMAVFVIVCRWACALSRHPHTTVTTTTPTASTVVTTSSQQDGSKAYPVDAGTDVKPASGYEMSTYPPPPYPYPPQQA